MKQDKNWMLNARAIKAAKTCIDQVAKELDIKLKLSHPDFLELLVQYTVLTESEELHRSVEELAHYAPAEFKQNLLSKTENILASEDEHEQTPRESAPAPLGNKMK